MNVNKTITRRTFQRLQKDLIIAAVTFLAASPAIPAQDALSANQAVQQQILQLTEAMNRVEAQMQQSQQELAEIRRQLIAIRQSSGEPRVAATPVPNQTEQLAEAVAEIRETQAMHESQIATLAQSKVESGSKYPVKLSGMILMTAFANTAGVDAPATPTSAVTGSGSTGATFQQTILGLDISGPRVFGARSHGDLRFDLNGGARSSAAGTGYSLALLRFRTAHANLDWQHTQASFVYDRPILNPEQPSSLTAVAEPALAWSGNLWAWNTQVGISQDMVSRRPGAFRVQAALTDVSDPPLLFAQNSTFTPPTSGELSRWPGVESRVAFESASVESGLQFGVSGLFAPHRALNSGRTFDSWAGAADFRFPVTRFMLLSGNAYRGAALGSLGAGAYKNSVQRTVGGELYFQPLDDIGGWVQWKQRAGERLQFNEAIGIDEVPANQLRPYALATPVTYYNLARNRTVTANAIYSPSAYLQFSFEYRRIASSYVTAPTLSSDVIGLAAGYRF